jgi:hypothetical protein
MNSTIIISDQFWAAIEGPLPPAPVAPSQLEPLDAYEAFAAVADV